MSTQPSYLAFDPTVAASTGTENHGGGLVSGNGTFYSKHSCPPGIGGFSDVITITSATGPITGTIIVQVSNSRDDLEALGSGVWITYSAVTLSWTSDASVFGYEVITPAFRRYRLKLVITSGTGTIKAERTIKGALR